MADLNSFSELDAVSFHVIGYVESPFNEKFLIPRQPGLVPILSKLIFYPPYNDAMAFDGLEGVTHLWLQFLFDGHKEAKSTSDLRVRPPRLGGNKKVGVFSTRSSFRPNPIGLSLVKLQRIDVTAAKAVLWIEGVDCLNGTKIIDIKPYLPYADIALEACNAMANVAPQKEALKVTWSATATDDVLNLNAENYFDSSSFWQGIDNFKSSLEALLALDPRPSYQVKNAMNERHYGVLFSGLDIKFSCLDEQISILRCQLAPNEL